MAFDLVIRAASVLIDGEFRPAEVGVTDGVIAAVGTERLEGRETVELADDAVLIPGIVDTHVHINEPGRTDWEGFGSASRAAAAGGVTTVIDMPLNSIPPTTTVEALDIKRDAAAKSVVNIGFWGGAVPQNLGHLRELWDAGVFGFKCFLSPSGVDEFEHLSPGQLDAAMEEIAGFGGLLIVHAEDPGVLDAHVDAGGGTDYHRFVESRPPEAEVTAIERVIAGSRKYGTRAHILHLSSAAALPALRAARADGLPITVETCPHYLVFDEENIPDGGTQFKCCPPIRDEANRELLWQALLDGDIDIIVTDHSPSTADLKFAGDGDFGLAWGGIAGLQTGLSAIWTEAQKRGIPLTRVLGWMSRSTADFAGLETKGRIAVGADADFVAFAPAATFTVHADRLLHKYPVSAFDGRELLGVVRTTWLAGVPVADDTRGTLLVR
ncbi:MAG: allantoinase AllB [Actinomycetota bacterium]